MARLVPEDPEWSAEELHHGDPLSSSRRRIDERAGPIRAERVRHHFNTVFGVAVARQFADATLNLAECDENRNVVVLYEKLVTNLRGYGPMKVDSYPLLRVESCKWVGLLEDPNAATRYIASAARIS